MNDDDDKAAGHQIRRLLTVADVADLLGSCTETVRRRHREQKIRAVPGLRKLRFTHKAVEEFLNGGKS